MPSPSTGRISSLQSQIKIWEGQQSSQCSSSYLQIGFKRKKTMSKSEVGLEHNKSWMWFPVPNPCWVCYSKEEERTGPRRGRIFGEILRKTQGWDFSSPSQGVVCGSTFSSAGRDQPGKPESLWDHPGAAPALWCRALGKGESLHLKFLTQGNNSSTRGGSLLGNSSPQGS